ncbi:hypothetical protein SLEP1_g56306 [Rubroshorea leprosula]|uniref:Uncharacterized protein n=1 Tax=Rubroshorea leprosula TaxID=152421 RepID=A0AAV5MJ81_9ROSI|nr:hypothetical protein SLEP1_g56306 [Rubroshorea leprosula]
MVYTTESLQQCLYHHQSKKMLRSCLKLIGQWAKWN